LEKESLKAEILEKLSHLNENTTSEITKLLDRL